VLEFFKSKVYTWVGGVIFSVECNGVSGHVIFQVHVIRLLFQSAYRIPRLVDLWFLSMCYRRSCESFVCIGF